MLKKILPCLIISFLLLPVFSATDISSAEEITWWNDNWSYREKIEIPIDTGKDNAKSQPIDINTDFDKPCWAKNEKIHSIRIIYQKKNETRELDCQIYDLNYTKEDFIDSCNLVFLIPQCADGKESYYLYYDNKEKNEVEYEDHLNIEESYYHYSTSYGLSAETWSYNIIQDRTLEYAIVKKGETSKGFLSQEIIKFKKGSKENIQNNYEHVLSCAFTYWWFKNSEWNSFSTTEKLISKDILIDGNLMVKCAVVSTDKNDRIKTTGIYTYYYCPTDNKRIFTNIKNELIDHPLPQGELIDATFAEINCGKVESNQKELNHGNIPPYLHFYSEEERVVSYDLDTNPENINWKKIIKRKDDQDLGNLSWVSVDHGEKGNAQSIIFNSNNIIKLGKDEPIGIQLEAAHSNVIKLPNLNAKIVKIYMNRNSFEEDKKEDTILPSNYIVEYKAEFFSSENGGYRDVEREAEIYKKLIDFKPDFDEKIDDKELENYDKSLTVYAHIPKIISSEILTSLILKKNTYISAELYHKNNLVQIKRLNRIPLTIKSFVDWKNISIFRKATFDNLKEGKYLVKIIVNNLFYENNDKFIGLKIIDLKDKTESHVFCRFEGKNNFFIYDQNKQGIKDVKIQFYYDNLTIFEGSTDSKGKLTAGLPSSINTFYKNRIFYKGFLINEENVDFGFFRPIISKNKNLSIKLHPLNVEINGRKKTEEKINLSITSKDMYTPQIIKPDKTSNDKYTFLKLPENDYELTLKYNQFELKKDLNIDNESAINYNLHKLSVEILDNWNLTPDVSYDIHLKTQDFEKKVDLSEDEIKENKYIFKDLFSGKYKLELYYRSHVINREIFVPYDKNMLSFNFPFRYNLSSKFYDRHGHQIYDLKIKLSRNNESITINSNEKKELSVSLPPGTYTLEAYHDNKSIIKRNINILSDTDLKIVSKKEPVYPLILTVSIVLFLVLSGIYLYRKEKITFLLKLIVISLVILSIVYPWWTLSGSSVEKSIETNTNLFLHNSDIITVTSYKDMVYGNFGLLGNDFDFAINITILTIAIGIALLCLNIFFKNLSYHKLSLLFLFLSLIVFIVSFVIPYFAISTFTSVIIGDFMGSGTLNISLSGTNNSSLVLCNWGPGIGFYLFLSALFMIGITVFLKIKNILKKSTNNNMKNYKL